MKQIIHIFGASGSGTSTLGSYLSRQLGYTWMDSDDYFWVPTDPRFTTKRPKEERIRLMRADIAQADHVVLSGSLSDWGNELIPMFTLAIRLVTGTQVRLDRIRAREYARFGNRILPGGDMYETHQAFLTWASGYDTGDEHMRSRLSHDLWQQLLQCPLLTLSGEAPLPELLAQVQEALVAQP